MTSPNGTVVTANTGGAITDSKGNIWTISASGLVVENGVADTFTANVTELAFKNGVLWQENTSFLWYAKVGNVPGSYHGWSPATPVAPVPVARQWVGGGNNSAGNPNDWNDHGVPRVGDSLTMSSGTMNVTGHQLMGDTIRAPTSATVTINVTGVTPYGAGFRERRIGRRERHRQSRGQQRMDRWLFRIPWNSVLQLKAPDNSIMIRSLP